MQDSDEIWDFYWEVHLREMEDLGKREAILAVSKLIRSLAARPEASVRLLEPGCGEGQIIGTLAEAHAEVRGIGQSVGVDYIGRSIEVARRRYSGIRFIQGDFTDPDLMQGLGPFEIVVLVNALHEVFSMGELPQTGDVSAAKRRVQAALALAVERIVPGGYLALFDGLEASGDIQQPVRIRFQHSEARRRFLTFAREYHPLKITYRETRDPWVVELSYRDFTRYIDKSIFLDKRLWQTERLESYQYFNEDEFRSAINGLGLEITELRTLTVNYEKWSDEVEIESEGVDFPTEHVLIVARNTGSAASRQADTA